MVGRLWRITFGLILLGTLSRDLGGEQKTVPGISRLQYSDSIKSSLDKLFATLSAGQLHRLLFSGHLNFSSGSMIPFVSAADLRGCVDAFKAAGMQAVVIDLSLKPWRDHVDDLVAKYDTLILYAQTKGLRVTLTPTYNRATDNGHNFQSWSHDALKIYPHLAVTYHPDAFVLAREPSTIATRMDQYVSSEQWLEFIQAASEAVKRASPQTRCAVQVLPSEWELFKLLLPLKGVEEITLNATGLSGLRTLTDMIQEARKAGKTVALGETWRNGWVDPQGKPPLTLDGLATASLGYSAFEELDARWLKTMTLWASAWGLESVAPTWTNTFFYYDRRDTSALEPAYERRVVEALRKGERTKTYAMYQALSQQYHVALNPAKEVHPDSGDAAPIQISSGSLPTSCSDAHPCTDAAQ